MPLEQAEAMLSDFLTCVELVHNISAKSGQLHCIVLTRTNLVRF